MQVADEAWLVLREQGAMIEEGEDDDAEVGGDFDEKDTLLEKVDLHISGLGDGVHVTNLVHTPGTVDEDRGGLE